MRCHDRDGRHCRALADLGTDAPPVRRGGLPDAARLRSRRRRHAAHGRADPGSPAARLRRVRTREPDRAPRRVDPDDRRLPGGVDLILREAFDYEFSRLDPTGPHIDPCHLAVYELLMVKGPDWAP